MAMQDIMNVAFPLQSLTTRAAMDPQNSMMGMATSPFAVGGGQGSGGQGGALMGLAGLVNQYGAMRNQNQPQANQFQSQTPGAPTQPGRIDQTSFGGSSPGDAIAMSGLDLTDPLALLDQNIMRRFGGQ